VPADSGALRLSGNTSIRWRNLSGTPNTLNIQGINVDASDNVVVGDNTNGTALFLDCKTGGTINLRVGAAVVSLSGTAIDFNGRNLGEVGDFDHDGTNLGFYGTAPIAKQTGVAVTAGGIHAALVALGLISA
jgi:hypothetical protein